MKTSTRFLAGSLLATCFLNNVPAGDDASAPAQVVNPQVEFETSKGSFTVELFAQKAPISTQNILDYVDAGFFAGTTFHRVIPGFMIQGGGLLPDMSQKANRAPIKNEATNGLKNKRGTLSMARTSVIDSATSQFFVNVADNAFLDHKDTSAPGFGYAVFGQVVDGMEVVDAIVAVKTANKGPHQNVPAETVLIIRAKRK